VERPGRHLALPCCASPPYTGFLGDSATLNALHSSGRTWEKPYPPLLHVLTQADSWVEKEEPTPSN
jgi:hypothetical protein